MVGEAVLGIPGLTPGGVGVYALLTAVMGGLIKNWPTMTKMAIDAKAAMRAEKRVDDLTCQQRIDAMEKRLDASDARAQLLQTRVSMLSAAYRVVLTELHRKDPKSPAIALAQALLADLAPILPDEETEKVAP